MRSFTRALSLIALLLPLTACGDPVVVLGDAPGYMRVVAGRGDSIGTRLDSIATRSKLTEPSAVVFSESTQLLYIADRGALRQSQGINTRVARIIAITSSGGLRLLVDAGGCSNGPCLLEPTAMTLAPDGTILIADGVGHRIFRFTPASNTLGVIAGTGQDAFSPDGTAAAQAALRRPAGVAVASDGSIYFSEEGANRVRRIDPGGVLHTVAGNGVGLHSGDGGAAAAATVAAPAGLTVYQDVLYIAESGAHTVRAIDLQTGQISTVAGNQAPGFRGDGGPAVQASLATPRAVAVSPGGGLYIADRDNHRVRLVNLQSGVITTYAGTGATQFNGSRQPAGSAALRTPLGLWAAARGFLFIADAGMHVVWRAALSL